jgi:hypothetical protein
MQTSDFGLLPNQFQTYFAGGAGVGGGGWGVKFVIRGGCG